MIPCPLCLLGFTEPHSREDWLRFANDYELYAKFERIMDAQAHKADVISRHGRHSTHSCPPGSRAMCDYADILDK